MANRLYEIHVSVNISTGIDEIRWTYLCKEHRWHQIRVTNATGEYQVQNMISKWCSRSTPEEAIERAKEVAQLITDAGITVVRTKVEALQENKLCIPYHPALTQSNQNYWEFHIKVITNDIRDLESLLTLSNRNKSVGLSMSTKSSTNYPIMTLRLSTGTLGDAIDMKDQLVSDIKKLGISIYDKIQYELAIYDSNPNLDSGWL